MKRLIPFLAMLTGCPTSTPVVPTAPSLTWTSNGNPGLPACGPSVKTGCLTTYTLKQDGVVLAQNIPGTSLSYVLSALPPSGTHVYQLVINGSDQSGNAIASAPASTTVVIP